MTDPPRSTAELLCRALGARAAGRLKKSGISLRDLGTASVSELVETYRLTQKTAERAAAVLELARSYAAEPLVRGEVFRDSAAIYRHFGPKMRDLKVEQFWVVLLDGKHRLIKELLVSQGTLTSSPVHPREVFSPAIRNSAAAIVLAHNHPSGDPTPSADDLDITRRLVQVGDLVGVRVLDHVICGDSTFSSLADRGLMS
jgi:DNA repair protein RadC